MKLALHRSITLWSGLVVMGFEGWSWRDSLVRIGECGLDRWSVHSAIAGILINQEAMNAGHRPWSLHEPIRSLVPASTFPKAIFERGVGRDYEADLMQLLEENPGMGVMFDSIQPELDGPKNGPLPILFGNMTYRPHHDWRVFLPHWLILLASALVWCCLLLWRSWRRTRHTHQEP